MKNNKFTALPRELTERQKQVLELSCHGLSRTEIAGQLGLRPLTVATHMKNVYRKLKVYNRAGAVAVALSQGLVEFSGNCLIRPARANYLKHVTRSRL